MSRSQREKGKRGERSAAEAIRTSLGIPARRGVQYSGLGASDLAVEADGIHWEVKFVERESVRAWMRQAITDGGDNVPAVVHKKSREPWLLTLPLERAYEFFIRLEEARSQAFQSLEREEIPGPVSPAVLPEEP